jgi:RES domain-containing protein
MRVARIVRASLAGRAMDGSGAALYGGRWNAVGTPGVYAADSVALAELEVFVQLGTTRTTVEHVCLTFTIDDALVDRLSEQDLPTDWQTSDGRAMTAAIGTEWLKRMSNVGLLLPSCIFPDEHIVLINPRHAAADRITIERCKPFSFDARMWKDEKAI